MRLQYLAGMALNSYLSSEILSDIHRYYKFPEALFVGSDALRKALRISLEGVEVAPAARRKEKTDSRSANIRRPNPAPQELAHK